MNQYDADKRWSDRFIPRIGEIVGRKLLVPAPYVEDAFRNTDLMVLKMEGVRIGCRIRRNKYADKYGDEFTIRCGRPSGNKTELAKIVEGWGDYFFYGFSSADEKNIENWTLCDLNVFRLWLMRYMASHKGGIPGNAQRNTDGSSGFLAFKFADLPDDFIVDSSAMRK